MTIIKTLAIGKIGSVMKFDRASWKDQAGAGESPLLYSALFRHNPDITFYIIGNSDWESLKEKEKAAIAPHGNVINIWKNIKKNTPATTEVDKQITRLNIFEEEIAKLPKIDSSLFFAGVAGTCNIPGRSITVREKRDAIVLAMNANYTAPIVLFINARGHETPFHLVVNDPRYCPLRTADLFYAPKFVFSQINEEKTNFRIRKNKDYNGELIEVNVPQVYSSMESIFLIDNSEFTRTKDIPQDIFALSDDDISAGEKDIKFLMVLNEGLNGVQSRYPLLKKYVLDHLSESEVEIYGKWIHPDALSDIRFKGSKNFNEIHSNILPRVKYTLCIPIDKGWATSKFWEMTLHGIIPFVTPEYDSQNNIGFPDYLRVSDGKELFKKINFLENNEEAYNILRDKLQALLRKEHFDGSLLNSIIMQKLKEDFNEK